MAAILIGGIALTVDKIKSSRAKRHALRSNTTTDTTTTHKRSSISSSQHTTSTTTHHPLTSTEYQARMLHKYNTNRFNTHPLHRAPLVNENGDVEDLEEEDEELPRYGAEMSAPGYRERENDEEEDVAEAGRKREREAERARLEAVAVAEAKVRSLGGAVQGRSNGWGWA